MISPHIFQAMADADKNRESSTSSSSTCKTRSTTEMNANSDSGGHSCEEKIAENNNRSSNNDLAKAENTVNGSQIPSFEMW